VASPAQSRGQRVMVFSNTVSSCRAAEHYLKEAGLRTVSYHGEVPSGEVSVRFFGHLFSLLCSCEEHSVSVHERLQDGACYYQGVVTQRILSSMRQLLECLRLMNEDCFDVRRCSPTLGIGEPRLWRWGLLISRCLRLARPIGLAVCLL
jgi:hypothetical protein